MEQVLDKFNSILLRGTNVSGEGRGKVKMEPEEMRVGRKGTVASERRSTQEGGAPRKEGSSTAFADVPQCILWSTLDAQCERPEADGACQPLAGTVPADTNTGASAWSPSVHLQQGGKVSVERNHSTRRLCDHCCGAQGRNQCTLLAMGHISLHSGRER